MENLGSKYNITYYNNSKATNISSAVESLLSKKNIFWIAGGILKEKKLNKIKEAIPNIIKVYLFGKSSIFFANYLKNKIIFEKFSTMKEAFLKAYIDARKIKKYCCIILAPACSSFDQFNNFQERGNIFIKLCNEKL